MKFERIRHEILKKPWGACTIILESGERIPVRHPEMIYFLKPWKELIVYDNGTSWRFEAQVVTAVEHRRRR